MPREERHIEQGVVYHLISRFVDREWFIREESERENYLRLLGRALSASTWRLLAFGVMSNHVHLAAVAGAGRLDRWIRRVHSPFADAMNRQYDRIGAMFVRGPKAYAIGSARVARLIAYIHNNPVRAGVVGRAQDSSWTSHRAYAGLVTCPRWLHVSEGLALLKLSSRDELDAWVASEHEADLRGDCEFTEEAEEARRLEAAALRAAEARARHQLSLDAIIGTVEEALGVSATHVSSRSRLSTAVTAREVIIHCGLALGFYGAEIARALRMSQQGVSVIARRPLAPQTLYYAERVTEQLVQAGSATRSAADMRASSGSSV